MYTEDKKLHQINSYKPFGVVVDEGNKQETDLISRIEFHDDISFIERKMYTKAS